MKWVTRRDLHVDRTACAWLIRRHIDPEAEFVFVAPTTDPASVAGHTFDMRDAEYTHVGDKCTFEVLLERHGLSSDKALCDMGQIIREADVSPRRGRAKESRGLDAIMRGFQLGVGDDYEKLRLTAPVYDALYTYCAEKSQTKAAARGQGTPRPRLRYSQRVVAHLQDESGESGDH